MTPHPPYTDARWVLENTKGRLQWRMEGSTKQYYFTQYVNIRKECDAGSAATDGVTAIVGAITTTGLVVYLSESIPNAGRVSSTSRTLAGKWYIEDYDFDYSQRAGICVISMALSKTDDTWYDYTA